MKTSIKVVFILSVFVCSCKSYTKYRDQLATAESFIEALRKSDTVKVMNFIGVNPEEIGVDSQHFYAKIRAAMRLIQQNSRPKKLSFEIKEYAKSSMDLVDVTVPFYRKGKQEIDGKIIMRFVKFLPANKIAFFEIDGGFIEEETIAPK